MKSGFVRLRNAVLALSSVASICAIASCDGTKPVQSSDGIECPLIAIPALSVEIRDVNGAPAATGATVSLARANKSPDLVTPKIGYGDSLRIYIGGGGTTGSLDVYISKPYHAPVVIRGVQVPSGPCGLGAGTIRVAASVNLLPGAPPVRQIVLPPYGYGLGGNYSSRIIAYVEAAQGVSREVVWTSRDPAVASVSTDGVVTGQCRATAGKTWVVAASALDAQVRDSVSVEVQAQGSTPCRST
jgi:hypothetical protein